MESFGNKVDQYLVVPLQVAIPVEHLIHGLLLQTALDLGEEPDQLLELHHALLFMGVILPIVVLRPVDVVVMPHTIDLQGLQEDLEVREAVVTRPVHHVSESNASSLEVMQAHNELVQVLMQVLEIL